MCIITFTNVISRFRRHSMTPNLQPQYHHPQSSSSGGRSLQVLALASALACSEWASQGYTYICNWSCFCQMEVLYGLCWSRGHATFCGRCFLHQEQSFHLPACLKHTESATASIMGQPNAFIMLNFHSPMLPRTSSRRSPSLSSLYSFLLTPPPSPHVWPHLNPSAQEIGMPAVRIELILWRHVSYQTLQPAPPYDWPSCVGDHEFS